MNYVKLSNLKLLKENSNIITIPFLTSAMAIDNINKAPQSDIIFQWILFIGKNFIIVSTVYFILFFIYLALSGWIEGVKKLPFTFVLATLILSFSISILSLYILKIKNLQLPLNILWILGLISISFNLFKLSNKQNT